MIVLRRNIVLGSIAAGLAGALVLLEPPRAVEREVRPLLPLIDVDAVTRLGITAPGGETATNLERIEGGEGFEVLEKHRAAARGTEVSVLLSELAAMTDLDVVGLGAGAAADFGLDDAGATRLDLDGPPGTAATLRVAAAEGGAVFVHLEGEDRVVRVPRFRVPPADPKAWFDSYVLVPIAGRELREVRVEGGGLPAPVTVRARAGDVGAYEDGDGQALDERLVSELLQRLRLATALDVVARPPEETPAVLTLGLDSYDGTSLEVRVTDLGSADGAAPRAGVAYRSDLGYAVEVSPAWIQQVLEVARRF
ncbi:MAG: DUF4340 domain-containing protein [Planctomycetota bacterium]|nr:DUF4340 domain-containing protein [Planctomycetota bacterium]